jgi:hypothetical protein
MNGLIVSAYKAIGTGALTIILLGLVSYLMTQGFFAVGRSWVVPTIVTPSDERILALNTRLAAEAASREGLLVRRAQALARIHDAERVAAAHQRFQRRFAEAVETERHSMKQQKQRLDTLRRAYAAVQEEIQTANRAFAGLSRTRAEELTAAKLMTNEGWLQQNYQLAQMAQANLSFSENESELVQRTERARLGLQGLTALTAETAANGPITRDGLELERDLLESRLELARAEETRRVAHAELDGLENGIARYDALLEAIDSAPLMRALNRNVTVAFVPYENLDNVPVGTPLFSCSVGFLWCREAGVVRDVLPGEVTVKHPARHQLMRGLMVEMELEDPLLAREELLHANRAPFFL